MGIGVATSTCTVQGQLNNLAATVAMLCILKTDALSVSSDTSHTPKQPNFQSTIVCVQSVVCASVYVRTYAYASICVCVHEHACVWYQSESEENSEPVLSLDSLSVSTAKEGTIGAAGGGPDPLP